MGQAITFIYRQPLLVLFDFTVGSMPTSPNKFTALLKHHRIHLEVVWLNGKAVRGMKVDWKDFASFPGYLSQYLPSPTAPASSAPKKRAKAVV
jgi:hypothetical protein